MNTLVTNLYPRPNGTIAGENLSCPTTGSGVSLAALDTNTKYVMIDVQDNNVIVTFDGTVPTATNGHLLLKEQGLITLSALSAKAAKFLGVTGTSVIHASQFV